MANGTSAPVDWRYYIANNTLSYCGTPTPLPGITDRSGALQCVPTPEPTDYSFTAEYWNPLQYFTDVHMDGTVLPGTATAIPGQGQIDHIRIHKDFYNDAANGTLPSVSWVVPAVNASDHAPFNVLDGQAFVTRVLKSLRVSPQWPHMAIFLAWDDWGGWYDHVQPPTPAGPDASGYGMRVPALIISPYVDYCHIDQQPMSFDAYDKFIEDAFLGGERLDGNPASPGFDGRADARSTAQPIPRETAMPLNGLGQESDLANDFTWSRISFPTPGLTPLSVPTPGNVYPTPDGTYCAG